MVIDIANAVSAPVEFDYTPSVETLALEPDGIKLTDDCRVQGKLKKDDRFVTVTGRLDCTAETQCSRCLETAELDISTDFEARYVAFEEFSDEAEAEVSGEDLELDVIEGPSFDLDEFVRERLLLEMPLQPICRELCKGLCDNCGANLNKTSCDCGEADTDPRWDALKNLN